MSYHFISVLGTSNYEPVSYDGMEVTSFVQLALIEKFHDLLTEDGTVTFLLTENARKSNWDDREYTDEEIDIVKRWPKAVRPNSRQKEGLHSQIEKNFPELCERVETVDIPNGQSEEEIWTIFQAINGCIKEKDQILFDITHSFRSIPLLSVTALNYAAVTKESSLAGIYYGAYEAANVNGENGIRQAPIFDLTLYNEILRWTHAAETLRNSGSPEELNEIVNDSAKLRNMTPEERTKWKPVSQYVKAVCNLNNDLMACRGGAFSAGEKKNIPSISYSYQKVKKARQKLNTEEKRETLSPLYDLLGQAEDSFRGFDVEENYQTGLAAVQWYLRYGMIQQGYTALEETAITYVCFRYGLNQLDKKSREDIAGCAITAMAKYMQEGRKNPLRAEQDNREEIWKEINGRDKKVDDRHEVIIKTLPFGYVDSVIKIKDIRNDINHFGMRENPLSSRKLQTKLENEYKNLMKEIQKMEDQRQ